jgi:hypothetical protein
MEMTRIEITETEPRMMDSLVWTGAEVRVIDWSGALIVAWPAPTKDDAVATIATWMHDAADYGGF